LNPGFKLQTCNILLTISKSIHTTAADKCNNLCINYVAMETVLIVSLIKIKKVMGKIMLRLIKIYTGIFLFITSVMGLIFCYGLIHPKITYHARTPVARLSSIVILSSLIILI